MMQAAVQPKPPKTSSKTHRRSRTGCFTCRLRRKKCDEGKPLCKACKHLGLTCEYKRPHWWGNVDQRKQQKEDIKHLIKRTKLSEKVSQISPLVGGADSPPELSRSGPTSDSSDRRKRSESEESGYSLGDYDLVENSVTGSVHGGAGAGGGMGIHGIAMDDPLQSYFISPDMAQYPFGHSFDVDAAVADKQFLLNGLPLPKNDSSFAITPSLSEQSSTFSTPALDHVGSPGDDSADSFQFLDFGGGGGPTSGSATPPVDLLAALPPVVVSTHEETDQQFLDHFLDFVVPKVFPILDINLGGAVRQQIVIPSLTANPAYMHCSLSVAAQALKFAQNVPAAFIDADIMRHRLATVATLCGELARDADHLAILEATLAMILFQTAVGHPDDALLDIPWHGHFQAAASVIVKLGLHLSLATIVPPRLGGPTPQQYEPVPFHMTVTAWIDILGATMMGRAPTFADTYREQHLCGGHSGLQELMGCDDQVMYLISEIACLEALKRDNMLSDLQLCEHVKSLAAKIDETEDRPGHWGVNPLAAQITAAFRYAARIYLVSLVPGFNRNQVQVKSLLDKLAATLATIPAGPLGGFDRSLVWVYLIGGAVSTPGSAFRDLLCARGEMLGFQGSEGSWGRMGRVLGEVWALEDDRRTARGGSRWREVMLAKGWDFLII